jgi:hypothetical protein
MTALSPLFFKYAFNLGNDTALGGWVFKGIATLH